MLTPSSWFQRILFSPAFILAAALAAPGPAAADGGVTFVDLAAADGSSISYRRAPSPRNALFDQLKAQPVYTLADLAATPLKARGAPGVALFDYDRDGDLDIYATNGPGTANSLYANQWAERGEVAFVDLAVPAGVAATDQDSQGVCFGDLDNDGDHDLLVLGSHEPNRLFENQGDGTFRDITGPSGLGGGHHASTSCAMGDVDGDGLLDVVVANSYSDWSHQRPYFAGEPFAHNEPNQLFLNTGGNIFTDASASSGIQDLAGLPPGTALLTWAIALVDYDQDGDVDLFTADDQTILPPAVGGGQDLGFIRLFENDGTGRFTDRTAAAGLDRFGAWMGLAFGDLDCDGSLDIFGTNLGDYTPPVLGFAFPPGAWASRWFLGRGDGTFADSGGGDLVVSPFGWGTTIADYDNDGDLDILYHGGFDLGPVVDASNPGVILQNQGCTAGFDLDLAALAGGTDHNRRTVHGMAMGDLDDDGFLDIVSVSNFDAPEPIPLFPYPVQFDSPFDPVTFLVPSFFPGENPGEFVWSGIQFADGTLAVEVNSGGNRNRWVAVDLVGAAGLVADGRVNRDGIGAVVSFSPAPGSFPVSKPVLGGSSYASQDSLTAHFGLGDARRGMVEVLWPGGVRNRLYGVRAGERLVFPEIPCSFADPALSVPGYFGCVTRALDQLGAAGVLDPGDQGRFLASALRAFLEARGLFR